MLLTPGVAGAAEWRLTPRVSANEVYSDNIQLDPAGQERDDLVTTLNAGASLRGTGARLTVNFDYNLQALRYANSSSSDSLNQQLQATANAELVKQIVFLDVRGTISQENVSSNGREDTTNIALTGNTTDVMTFSVTPIVRHHFGSFAEAEGSFGIDTVDTDGAAGAGTTQNMRFNMNSGPAFSRLPWTFSTSRRKIDNDSGTETRFSSAEGTVRYKFTRQYGVRGSAGYESNSFATSQGSDGGAIWSIGGIWTPTPRTNVEAGYRSRFFDPGYFLTASHRTRRMVFTANYDEDITTSSQQLLDRQLIPLEDAFGDPVLDPVSGDQVLLPVDRSTLTEEVQVSKRFSASASYRGRRGSASFSVFEDRRTFQLSGDEEHVFGFSASASRQLSRRTSMSLNGSWQRSNPAGTGGGNSLWSVGASLNYQFSQGINASLDLRRLTREGQRAADSHDEHRASVRVDVRF